VSAWTGDGNRSKPRWRRHGSRIRAAPTRAAAWDGPAQTAELAPTYVFLASDESRFVVGEVIGVTGGLLLPS
jgi:NAD(P)-dependent dehydrogenase (short-subunit alcohol dehydrogenase family)